MDTPQVPTQVFQATEVQFKSFRNAVAAHFVLCTKVARSHVDALNALITFADVVAYDITTRWPVNPDMGTI